MRFAAGFLWSLDDWYITPNLIVMETTNTDYTTLHEVCRTVFDILHAAIASPCSRCRVYKSLTLCAPWCDSARLCHSGRDFTFVSVVKRRDRNLPSSLLPYFPFCAGGACGEQCAVVDARHGGKLARPHSRRMGAILQYAQQRHVQLAVDDPRPPQVSLVLLLFGCLCACLSPTGNRRRLLCCR